jgi:hypothetical protein
MNIITYTGTGSSLTLPNANSTPTSISFSPDWVWIKSRSQGRDNNVYDTVRGPTKLLSTNSTTFDVYTGTVAEQTVSGLTAFNSNSPYGFDLGSDNVANQINATYVAWCWDAGSSTVPNTQGSIPGGSQVRANTSAGFSIVTFNMGSANTYTVGHGLNVAPEFIITKSRGPNAFHWYVYHKTLGTSQVISLNSSNPASASSNVWSSTAPSSTVFGIVSGQTQPANDNIVAYCFAPVAGYSSFGSYTGNGSADGPFVFTGFRPRWIMIKCSTISGEYWEIMDTSRIGYNFANYLLFADLKNQEESGIASLRADILSNGFKLRLNNPGVNANNATYIYAAFAEAPFKYARAR